MKYYVWLGSDMDDIRFAEEINRQDAAKRFGSRFVKNAENDFLRQTKNCSAIVNITYNLTGNQSNDDYIHCLTISE